MRWLRTKTDFLIPAKRYKQITCGHCKRVYSLKNETQGRLFLKDGRPICAMCRVIKVDRQGRAIMQNKKNAHKDWQQAQANLDKAETERIKKIASQNPI